MVYALVVDTVGIAVVAVAAARNHIVAELVEQPPEPDSLVVLQGLGILAELGVPLDTRQEPMHTVA